MIESNRVNVLEYRRNEMITELLNYFHTTNKKEI